MGDLGRTSKLTEDVQKALCESLSKGLDRRHSCLLAGIDASTLRRWMARGRKGDAAFLPVLHAVKKAEAEAVARNVAMVQKVADDGTWQAAAWWLERRHPDLYGSDRKRVRELERLLAEIIGANRARTHPGAGQTARRQRPS